MSVAKPHVCPSSSNSPHLLPCEQLLAVAEMGAGMVVIAPPSFVVHYSLCQLVTVVGGWVRGASHCCCNLPIDLNILLVTSK